MKQTAGTHEITLIKSAVTSISSTPLVLLQAINTALVERFHMMLPYWCSTFSNMAGYPLSYYANMLDPHMKKC